MSKTERDWDAVETLANSYAGTIAGNIALAALAERRRLENENRELESALAKACPCHLASPCQPRCTCREPMSSAGCLRCCRYGSDGQRRQNAERIALEAERGKD